jgi:hypothetical protein
MKTTKVRIALCSTLLIVLNAITAFAADVMGTWTMETKDPRDGNVVKSHLHPQRHDCGRRDEDDHEIRRPELPRSRSYS